MPLSISSLFLIRMAHAFGIYYWCRSLDVNLCIWTWLPVSFPAPLVLVSYTLANANITILLLHRCVHFLCGRTVIIIFSIHIFIFVIFACHCNASHCNRSLLLFPLRLILICRKFTSYIRCCCHYVHFVVRVYSLFVRCPFWICIFTFFHFFLLVSAYHFTCIHACECWKFYEFTRHSSPLLIVVHPRMHVHVGCSVHRWPQPA